MPIRVLKYPWLGRVRSMPTRETHQPRLHGNAVCQRLAVTVFPDETTGSSPARPTGPTHAPGLDPATSAGRFPIGPARPNPARSPTRDEEPPPGPPVGAFIAAPERAALRPLGSKGSGQTRAYPVRVGRNKDSACRL